MKAENPSIFKQRRRGGVRRQRADDYIADQLLTRADKLMSALDDALEDENNLIRLRAVKMCMEIQNSVDERRWREQEGADGLTAIELKHQLIAQLKRNLASGAIDAKALLGEVIEGEAVEVVD